MTSDHAVTSGGSFRLGWILVLGVSAFVLLASLFVVAVPVDRDFFAETTGLVWAEFAIENPAVARSLERTGRRHGISFGAFGLFALVVSWSRLRIGDRWAARVMWILPLVLAAVTMLFVANEATVLAAFYGAMAMAAAAGLVLVARAET